MRRAPLWFAIALISMVLFFTGLGPLLYGMLRYGR